jgi:hypothetical protein
MEPTEFANMQEISRRSLLAGLGMTALFAMSGETAQAKGRQQFFERTGLPIGLQIYTLDPDAGRA